MEFAPTWQPSEHDRTNSGLAAFARFAEARSGRSFGGDYHALWQWSVEDVGDFWGAVWDHFGLPERDPARPVLAEERMPGAVWFPGTRLNYVDQVFRHRPADEVAVVALDETGAATETTWRDLERQVAAVAAALRDAGVGPGDRVVGYLGNRAETLIAFLATASLGAVWAVCGLDYAPAAAIARLGQLQPKALITATAYTYAGKRIDASPAVTELLAALGDVVVFQVGDGKPVSGARAWPDVVAGEAPPLEPVAVPFDHPLWVLFSSGTTGQPKGIMHGHGGVVLESLKWNALQFDLGPGDRVLWYTTPSWMMWNALISALLVGATVVCLDGSPGHPSPDALWRHAEAQRVALVGTSPAYVGACLKAGVDLRERDLATVRYVGITGSAFSPEAHIALAAMLPDRVQIASASGGTDVVTAFLGTSAWVPVWPGELSCVWLGVALDAYDEQGRSVRGEVGELVVTRPMPSMPVGFWDDADGSRYRDAYFSTYPGVWRHGDWITLTERHSVVIHGRSDATLNRRGIRIGSSDLCAAVEALPEVAEAMVIGLEEPGDGYWMPLFVVPVAGVELDDALRERIRQVVAEQVSPRHVPDEVLRPPAIPHTKTGKKLEIPVKRILAGAEAATVADPNSVDDPAVLAWYAEIGRVRRG